MNRILGAEGKWIRRRMGVLCGVLGIGLGLVISAAHELMVSSGQSWRELAEKQRERRLRVRPKRGMLLDRNGSALAASVEVPTVSLDAIELLRGVPESEIKPVARRAAEQIAAVLGLEAVEVERKIISQRRWTWLKRRVSAQEIEAIRKLSQGGEGSTKIRGLLVEGEPKRFYPRRELGSSLIGFVAPDGKGKDGLEFSLNEELEGHPEELRGLRDRAGKLIFTSGIEDDQAFAGHNIELSIDQAIQFAAERELENAARAFEAIGGSVVVVDPKTGELLAMASYPGYNPNDYSQSSPEARRTRAATDAFEPGSTIKIFTIAAALEEKTLSPTDQVFCEEGTLRIDNVTIRDTHPAGFLSVPQILAQSSNICSAKVGLGLGPERLYESFRRFGFGQRTGLPLPSEAPGTLRPQGRGWVQVETASAAFGQGISVSNLQLAMATAAIANGGELMEPILVRRVTTATGEIVREAAPRVRRRVVSASVAHHLTEMLIAVTEDGGTGTEAQVEGHRVAGKTATAQKADPKTMRYSVDDYVASFVGFVPAHDPEVVISVTLDEPRVDHAGGAVAAPIFREVAEMVLRLRGVAPPGTKRADLRELSRRPDPARVTHTVLASVLPAESDERPLPAAQELTREKPKDGQVSVPDLTGVPMRSAMERMRALGVIPVATGSGLLVKQEPPPGSPVDKGVTVVLHFRPAS